jgi:hypothetical protein
MQEVMSFIPPSNVHNFQYNLTLEFSNFRKKWYDYFEITEKGEILTRFFSCAQEERRDTERSDFNGDGKRHRPYFSSSRRQKFESMSR